MLVPGEWRLHVSDKTTPLVKPLDHDFLLLWRVLRHQETSYRGLPGSLVSIHLCTILSYLSFCCNFLPLGYLKVESSCCSSRREKGYECTVEGRHSLLNSRTVRIELQLTSSPRIKVNECSLSTISLNSQT